jgi:CDP-6-deoxy-D-xylo-4-hexulose-3-dehydrase
MQYKLATSTWDECEINSIHEVIESKEFTMGKKVQEYEIEFAKFMGSKYAVMTSSGSTANLIATAALFYSKNSKLKIGDEVIVPAVSWSTTYFPLQQYGLKLKFVDIDIETLNYNLTDLEDAISESTKLIVVVNLLGNSNDFNEINKIIGSREILLLEDNCESMGSNYHNKFTGTFGVMGTFSSFFSHHISTMEGGVVVTNDEELYHILLCLRAHGWTRNLPIVNHVANKLDNWFDESFRFILPGYNVRPLEMSGAIGIEQLKKLPNFLKQRRENANLFKSLFENDQRFYIQKEIGESSWFGFSIILKNTSTSFNRNNLINILIENDIECRPIVTGNFAKKEVLKYFNYEIHNKLKNADWLDSNGFFVGNSQEDLSAEIEYLHKILSKV